MCFTLRLQRAGVFRPYCSRSLPPLLLELRRNARGSPLRSSLLSSYRHLNAENEPKNRRAVSSLVARNGTGNGPPYLPQAGKIPSDGAFPRACR